MLVVLLGPGPAGADHPACDAAPEGPPSSPPLLCGTVRLSGDSTGWVRVRLAEPTTVDLTRDPGESDLRHVDVEGDGRVVGFILHRESPDGSIERDHQVRVIRMRSRGGSYQPIHANVS